jgi:competence protein ComEA
VHRRLALAALLVFVLSASKLREILEIPRRRPACVPEGRGVPPRHWLGCSTDRGPRRALAGDERLVLGLPVDPNRASSRDLAFVPGLSRRLAAEIALDRERNGPYRELAELLRVRGIGPRKLATAAPHLAVSEP